MVTIKAEIILMLYSLKFYWQRKYKYCYHICHPLLPTCASRVLCCLFFSFHFTIYSYSRNSYRNIWLCSSVGNSLFWLVNLWFMGSKSTSMTAFPRYYTINVQHFKTCLIAYRMNSLETPILLRNEKFFRIWACPFQ